MFNMIGLLVQAPVHLEDARRLSLRSVGSCIGLSCKMEGHLKCLAVRPMYSNTMPNLFELLLCKSKDLLSLSCMGSSLKGSCFEALQSMLLLPPPQLSPRKHTGHSKSVPRISKIEPLACFVKHRNQFSKAPTPPEQGIQRESIAAGDEQSLSSLSQNGYGYIYIYICIYVYVYMQILYIYINI